MTSVESFTDRALFGAGRLTPRGRASRGLRRALSSAGRGAALVLLLGAGLEAATLWVPRQPASLPPSLDGAGAWRDIRRPLPLFGLTGTDFSKLPLDYKAARHGAGGGRRDTLTFGDPRGGEGWLRLSLYRTGAEAASPGPALDDFAVLTRDLGGTVSGLADPTALPTRFGPFEAIDLHVALRDETTPCVGFRSLTGAVLRVAGLACQGADRPVGRDLVGCVVDRIDLLSAGEDEGLRDAFVAAERRRGAGAPCSPARPSPAGGRATWLDVNAPLPPLKP